MNKKYRNKISNVKKMRKMEIIKVESIKNKTMIQYYSKFSVNEI